MPNHFYDGKNMLEIHAEISEDFSGEGKLKICLSNYDFESGKYSSKCDIFIEEYSIIIQNNCSYDYFIDLNSVQDNVYRLFVQLTFKSDAGTKTRKDCDDNNFLLVKKESNINCVTVEDFSGIILQASFPKTAIIGEKTNFTANITNMGNCDEIIAYSYIFNGSYFATGNLEKNIKILNITKYSSSSVIFENLINSSSKEGEYYYVLKAESCKKTYGATGTIILQENEPKINNFNISAFNEPNYTCPLCECIYEEQNVSNLSKTTYNSSKITMDLNLKRDEYFYIPTILIGLSALALMYVRLK
jgi:hypothetical protein